MCHIRPFDGHFLYYTQLASQFASQKCNISKKFRNLEVFLCTIEEKVTGFIYMNFFKLFFLLLLSSTIYAKPIIIDKTTNDIELLSQTEIFIDNSQKETIHTIPSKKFVNNEKSLLGFGYSPSFNVWVKFTLHNKSNTSVTKLLEYENSLSTKVLFYDELTEYKDGLLNMNSKRKSINPTFHISLQPNETKTYYLQASSYITSLIIKLRLWDIETFYSKEITHQLALALFFGAMIILGLYNLFIYFFTKDISYLYYVLYLAGIIIHHTMYVGVGPVYILDSEIMPYIIKNASIFIAFPVFALALFSKSFLRTYQYPKLNYGINIFLVLLPVSVIFFSITDQFNQYRNSISLYCLVYLMAVTIFATFKRNRQAYFVLFGWFIISLSILFMYLSSLGIFNVYEYFSYIVELCLVLEAIIFSIALADRIKQLQKEKNDANNLLIVQQANEKERLAIQVKEKTQDLKTALDEKGLLLKELNHRVKNNMQTIVSLIRLQSDEVENEQTKELFITIQNRINAMSHLHELLYKQDNISYVNAYEYFDIMIDELKESYDNNVKIQFDIQSNLKMEQAVYCGLILNELITNSFKYAFSNNEGQINVTLHKNDSEYCLQISDNGIGYDFKQSKNSLGLVLVNTLAKHQLRGDLHVESTNGVTVTIRWNNYE